MREWQWYCSGRTCSSVSFALPGFELLNSGSVYFAHYSCATVTSALNLLQFQAFYSGTEGLVVYCSDWMCSKASFAVPEFELLTSGSVVLHPPTVEEDLKLRFSPLIVSAI